MNQVVTVSARSADFQRAFVALRYFWGARGEALVAGFGALKPQSQATELLSALGDATQQVRAQALAAELARLAADLDQRGLVK
ncbi:MAG TPA: hypothetical protein VJN18_08545 [Polyangiaceae bacterium]|nr:hypothetical protein [Polyangiaceae bacterium]